VAKIFWETIEIGDPVTPLTKPPVTRVQIARYAGASDDYSPLHIDDDFAKAAGYGGIFAHGAISFGFAIEAASTWLENGRIIRTDATFQKLVWPGDILTAKGVVVAQFESGKDSLIDIDVWTENQNGDVVMRGKFTCLLWRSEKEGKKSKSPWPEAQTPATLKPKKIPERVPEKKTAKKKTTKKKTRRR